MSAQNPNIVPSVDISLGTNMPQRTAKNQFGAPKKAVLKTLGVAR